MSDEQMLEIRIESQDPALIAEIESALAEVNPKRWEKTRDLITIIAIAASTIELINALLELREHLSKKPDAPKIYVLNADRKKLTVDEATEVTLTELIKPKRRRGH